MTPKSDSSWEDIKLLFGVRESYHQLFHQAIQTKYYNVHNDYYFQLKTILEKLNSKYN